MGWFNRSSKRTTLEKPPDRKFLFWLGALLLAAIAPQYGEMPLGISLYFSLLFLLHFSALRYPQVRPKKIPLVVLLGIGIWLVVRHYHTLFGYEAGITLLALLLAMKLLEVRNERDLYVTFTLGLFFIVTRFLLHQSMYWAGYSLLVVVGFLLLIAAYNRKPILSFSKQLRFVSILMFQAVPLAVLLFLLFPRLTTPLWDLQLGGVGGVTGLSESMAPGSINNLVRSDETAFRAEFVGPPPEKKHLYWRGPVLWQYNGLRWTRGEPYGHGEVANPLTRRNERIDYRLILEPHGKRWILALDLPVKAPRQSRLTPDYQLLSNEPIRQKKSFQLAAYSQYNTGSISDHERRAGLQLPSEITQRTKDLVSGWKERATDDVELMKLALEYFNREAFVYTLSPPLATGNISDSFLFETRAGFCEHYASAFTLLMRLGGIPSRVVTGYLGGEYNELGNYIIVQQADAHAWSEIWLEGRGWVRVDPTGAVAPERIEHPIDLTVSQPGLPITYRLGEASGLGNLVRTLRLSLDTLNTKWHIWVLGYNSSRQSSLLHWLGLGYLEGIGMSLLMIGLSAAFIVALAWWLVRRRSRPTDPVVKAYESFCRKMARIGITRQPSEGPNNYAARIGQLRPDLAEAVNGVISMYCWIRFGKGKSAKNSGAFTRRVAAFRPTKSLGSR